MGGLFGFLHESQSVVLTKDNKKPQPFSEKISREGYLTRSCRALELSFAVCVLPCNTQTIYQMLFVFILFLYSHCIEAMHLTSINHLSSQVLLLVSSETGSSEVGSLFLSKYERHNQCIICSPLPLFSKIQAIPISRSIDRSGNASAN